MVPTPMVAPLQMGDSGSPSFTETSKRKWRGNQQVRPSGRRSTRVLSAYPTHDHGLMFVQINATHTLRSCYKEGMSGLALPEEDLKRCQARCVLINSYVLRKMHKLCEQKGKAPICENSQLNICETRSLQSAGGYRCRPNQLRNGCFFLEMREYIMIGLDKLRTWACRRRSHY